MKSKSLFNSRNLATFVTIGLFIFMFGAGSVAFTGFFSVQNFFNLFIDNAYLLIIATGITFVIISGGIDLSVGSVLALSTMLSSSLLTKSHMHPALVIPIVLMMGTTLGFFMGYMIHNFVVPPFIITLAGLYLARGLCYIISIDTIPVNDEFFYWCSSFRVNIFGGIFWGKSLVSIIVGIIIHIICLSSLWFAAFLRKGIVRILLIIFSIIFTIGTIWFYVMFFRNRISFSDNSLSISALLALAVVIAGFLVMRLTKFGRAVYAIGGNEQSALLMGLPVGSTKVVIYSLSSFCAALAGIVFTFYTLSGYALNGKSMEMDSIASVVIGGTLLTGGVGNLVGTVFGVLVYGIIQTLIMFQGTLNSWWTRIVIGFLVFLFCFLQRIFEARGVRKQKAPPKAVPEKT